jgi:putative two-component system protein, hydrogenase maturation factor HypX/HoxX
VKILLLGSAFSGLCQRVLRELVLMGHQVDQHYGMNEPLLRQQLSRFEPQLIICPFLTHRIPEDIWKSYRCLVVHPGIEGDRGPSSLDWAISQQKPYWGVTLLQADSEMDAGDIWGTENFPMREASKTSIYKREVSSAAVALIKQAVQDFQDARFKPRPLDYSNPRVEGMLQPLMKQTERSIHWLTDSTDQVLAKINAADTIPGVLDALAGQPVHLFGASRENQLRGEPGELLAIAHGALCRATRDGAIWIRQAKIKTLPQLAPIKLPAALVAKHLLTQQAWDALTEVGQRTSFNDIWVEREGPVAYVHFDFYNGAASTAQCERLVDCLRTVKASDARVLVLMGGDNFFSNGIHLNTIEASADPAEESWRNINAIDDVVREIILSPAHITLAALRNNAGAGGAILALACDKVVGREGVVLNPHYQNMGLFGSEYWTYLLPKRVGKTTAHVITRECQPMLMNEALDIRMVDEVFQEDWQAYHQALRRYAQSLAEDGQLTAFLAQKHQQRSADEAERPLETYRQDELAKMKAIFDDPNSSYHEARRNFVYKITPQNPCWLAQSSAAKAAVATSTPTAAKA